MPWFTVREVAKRCWRVSEELHEEHVHSYVVAGEHAAFLIDSGLGVGNIAEIVHKEIGVPIEALLTTHSHWDHVGGHGHFEGFLSHSAECDILPDDALAAEVRASFAPERLTGALPGNFHPEAWQPFQGKATGLLEDGQCLSISGRSLQCIHAPGHSPGHVCFLDAENDLLFTGDLLYAGTLYCHFEGTHPEHYHASLRRLASLSTEKTRILPSHNQTPLDVGILREAISLFDSVTARGALTHGAGRFKTERLALLL